MIILGVDTSGYSISVALMRDRELLGEMTATSKDLRHAVMLQPLLEALSNTCHVPLSAVDLFAVTNGPGSFTGIRSGLATVKAMAYAAGGMAVGVSSLRALARVAQEDDDALVLPMFDARGGRVYASLYRDGKACFSDEPRRADVLVRLVLEKTGRAERVILAGDGLRVVQTHGLEAYHGTWPFTAESAPPERQVIRASAVAQLAFEDLNQGSAETDPFKLDAHYAIAASAEREHKKQEKRPSV